MKEKTNTTSRLYAIPWILLFLLINIFLLVNGIGKTYARQALDELIEQELPPYYQLAYDELELNLFDRELTITNLIFTPDSSIQRTGADRSYRVHIPHFNVRLKSLEAILYRKELIVEGITVVDPQFAVMDFSKDRTLTATTESFSLFELVRQYLSVFRVKSFEVKNAGLQYQRDNEQRSGDFLLKAFDFRVNEFALDSNLTRQNFLNAESVELIINKQQFYLSDNIHRFSFDQFRMSTRDSVLNFSNVLLEPRDTHTAAAWSPASGPALYRIAIPEVNLNGIDYYESYLNKDLRIDQVVFQSPQIDIAGGQRRLREAREPGESAVLDVLAQIAPSLRVGHIQLNQANVNLDFQEVRDRDFHFLVDYINLYQCVIDPTNITYSRANPPFQDFSFQLSEFRERLPDGLHVLQVGQVLIPSMNEGITLKDFSIVPYREVPHPHKIKVVQHFPFLSVDGIDYLGFLQQEPLRLGHVFIKEPVTRIITPLESQQDSSRKELKIAGIRSSITGSFLQEISAERLNVEAGRWQLDDWMQVGTYDFDARGFLLNEQTQDWKSLADTFSLNIADLDMQRDSMTVHLEQFVTDGSYHDFQSIRFSRKSSFDSIDVELEGVTVFQTDLDQLMNQEFKCDSLYICDLVADVRLKKSRKGDAENIWQTQLPFSAPKIHLDNFELDLETPRGDRLSFHQFRAILSADSLLQLKNMQLFNLEYLPAGGTHRLRLDELEKSGSSDSYELTELEWRPLNSSPRVRHPLRIPSVSIVHWDRHRYFEKKEWSFEKILLDSPELSVFERLQDSIPVLAGEQPDWPLVILDSLEIHNTQFYYDLEDSVELSMPQFDLSVQGINTKKRMITASAWTDLYRSFQFQSRQGISLKLPGTEFRTASLNISDQGNSTLEFRNVFLKTELTPLKQQTYLDRLSVRGLSLDQLARKQALMVDSLSLGEMNVTLFQLSKDSSRSTPFKRTAPLVHLPFQAMDIGFLQLKEAYLDLHMNTSLSLDRVQLLSRGIRTDSVLDVGRLEDHYEYLDLKLDNISYVLGKYKEYELSQSLHYTSGKKQLLLSEVALAPLYAKEHFSRIIPHQEDLFDIQADSVIFHGFEWGALFNPSLYWPKIEVKQLDLDIFRDQNPVHPNNPQDLVQEQIKRIPFPFLLDTLEVSTDIHFAILPENTRQPGEISFEELEGRLLHITNLDSLWKEPMRLEAKAKLYGTTDLEARMSFDMADPMNSYTMSGRVGRMDIKLMNKILTPTARIFIRKGKCKEITFEVSANKDVAIGDMFFRYNKLKFRIVDKDDIHHISLGNSLLSFWANRLVKSNNPSFLRKRKGVIYFERNHNRAIFHYWSRALLSGVVSSVGVKNNRKQLKKLGYENLEALNYQELFGEKENN
jgi:hypothetical protein